MKSKHIFWPLIVMVVSIAAVWLIFNNKPTARQFPQPPAQKLRTEVMQPVGQSHRVWVPSHGVVQPKNQSLVIAQVSGAVTRVADAFRDGAFFVRGDELLVIDDADYRAQLVIAQAELKLAESNLADERARAEQALKDWRDLGNSKKPPALVAREPQLNSALSAVDSARAKVLQAELNLQRTRITAPFDGRVLSLDVNVGQVVGNGTTLGSIYAVDAAEVRLPLLQKDLAHLKLPEIYRDQAQHNANAPIPVRLQAVIGNKTHQWMARLTRVEGTIDAQTRQLYVVAEVEDPYRFRDDGTPPLKMGQFVTAQIRGEELHDVVVLPRAAVSADNTIYLISDDVLERTEITPLWSDAKQVIIAHSFTDNQRIGITPLGDVVSGTRVEIIDPHAASEDTATHATQGARP